MNGSHPSQRRVHSPSKARTRTREATHTENRATECQSFSSPAASGAPAYLGHRGPEVRFVDHHRTRVHPEAVRATHQDPTYAQKGKRHASSRHRQPENATGSSRNTELVTILQRPSDPMKTSVLRRRSEAAIRQTSLQASVKGNGRQANIPPGSRIDEWCKDVARANPFTPYHSSASPPQSLNRGHTRSYAQLSKPLEPSPLVDAEPKRYDEYVYGPNDGVSQADSESEHQSRLQGGPQRPRAGNGTPYPWDYKRQFSYTESQVRTDRKASAGGETDPSEY